MFTANIERLISLWKKISVTDSDLVIFLGDYVDRGADSVKVLKWLINESKKPNVVTLCGNHEDMLKTDLAAQIPTPTRMQIAKQKAEEPRVEDEVFDFLKSLPYSPELTIDGRKFFCCHAGIDPIVPLEEQDPLDLLWIREKFRALYDGDAVIVAGHTPVMMLKSDEEIAEVIAELQSRPENFGKTPAQIVDEMIYCCDEEHSCYADGFTALTTADCKPQWRRGGKILLMDTGSFLSERAHFLRRPARRRNLAE